MYGDRDDRQVEVVKHYWNVVMEACSRVEVEAEGPTADEGNSHNVSQSESGKNKYQKTEIH